MGPAAKPRRPAPAAALRPALERALLEQAAALSQAHAGGRPQTLLRGRHLGLLCVDDGTPAARLFRQAAVELGAHVVHIPAAPFAGGSTPAELAHAARLLGRLYDAVECQGLAPAAVQQLAALAGIVVCDGLASDGALIARLSRRLGAADVRPETRRFVLQAMLLQRLT